MNQKLIAGILLLLFASATAVSAQCPGGRYQNKIFTNVDVTSDVVYGVDTLSSGNPDTLKLDVYVPQGDTVKNRPVVILAHGGSFVIGFKSMPDMVALCRGLAQRGYVAISMAYRKESPLVLNNAAIAHEAMVKTVMRAVQDGKAVIRYVRKSFVEMGDPYGVDTSNVHIGGASAGAILAMQVAFMDDVNKLTPRWQPYAAEVGGLEGSNNLGYSARVNSVISMAGALGDTSYLSDDNLLPVLSSHSEDDNTVLYGIGKPLSNDSLPTLYGSLAVNDRIKKMCGVSWFDSHPGANHPPYNAGAQTDFTDIDSIIGEFLYRQQPCYPGTTLQDQLASQIGENCFTSVQDIKLVDNNLSLFPNPTSGIVNIQVDKIMNNSIVEVYNSVGQLSYTERMNSNRMEMNLNDLNRGIYFVRVVNKDKQTVSISKKLMLN